MAGKPFRVVRDTNYPQMYRLEWPDGVKSADMYNLSRAKDILRNYDGYVDRMQMGSRPQNRRLAAARRSVVSENDA